LISMMISMTSRSRIFQARSFWIFGPSAFAFSFLIEKEVRETIDFFGVHFPKKEWFAVPAERIGHH